MFKSHGFIILGSAEYLQSYRDKNGSSLLVMYLVMGSIDC